MQAALNEHYAKSLLAKKDQGKVFEITGKCRYSNHFLRSGSFTRFYDWWFIHRAKLNCLPSNWEKQGDKRCRKCGNPQETLPHVIGHCGVHYDAIQRRHNNIQDRLVKGLKLTQTAALTTNKTVQGEVGELAGLRPDIVIRDDVNRRITIIDKTIRLHSMKLGRGKLTNIPHWLRALGERDI